MAETTGEPSRDTKLRMQSDRGIRARIVKAELEKAFVALEQDVMAAFRNSDVHDSEGQKTCRLYLKVMDDVKGRFEHFIKTGEEARKELTRLREPLVKRVISHVRRASRP